MGCFRAAFAGIVGAIFVAVLPSGCGNRGSTDSFPVGICQPGKATCLSDAVGQICNQQGQWATFQCNPGRTCSDGACRVGQQCTDGDCGETCTPETHECASGALQRICRSDGSGWLIAECPSGGACENGDCVGSCMTGESSCLDTRRLRRCRDDGAGYSDYECPPSMTCTNGSCAPNNAATCVFGQDVCLNETSALVCLRNGSGYSVKDCPSDTRCRAGKCIGSVCSPGTTSCANSTTADFAGIQTCNSDGSGFSIKLCTSTGKCVLDPETSKHECYVAPCTSGDKVCGDPSADKPSTDYVSRCENLANGKLGWVVYTCDSPSTCKSKTPTDASCHAECSPGDKRCNAKGTAVETCSDSGAWVAATCATTTDPEAMCVLNPVTKEVSCGDKDCRTLQTTVISYTTRGRCSSNLIKKCGEDGHMAAAVACDDGQCVRESDGFGTCKDPARCSHEDGWRECIASNDAYRTCTTGHWEFTLCNDGEACTNVGDGLATCGNDCISGRTRCVDAEYQTCASDGTWGAAKQCSVGECNALTNRCETACVPGQQRCVGDVSVASDGTSLGSRAVQTCTASGAWARAQNCAPIAGEATLCRRSGVGEPLGCVRCVGSAVPAGNEEGAVDSRCRANAEGYQVCQADNSWPATGSSCNGTEHCAKQRDGSITGTCSNYGCATGKAKRCVGYETVTTAVTVEDCCEGECDSAAEVCRHRQAHYDPTCLETSSCFTGRYDDSGAAINETCCAGFCRSGQGCLSIKATACKAVARCAIKTVDHNNICCGNCLNTGLCSAGGEAKSPFGEYFACGSSTNICLGIGACTWQSSGATSGAMFANCIQ